MANNEPLDAAWVSASIVPSAPEPWWSMAIEYLVSGDHLLLLLDQSLRIQRANLAFWGIVAAPSRVRGLPLTETLTQESAHDVMERLRDGKLSGEKLQLLHPVKGGTRSIQYYFSQRDGVWVIVGRDETEQMELVRQLSCFVNDLEGWIDIEKEQTRTFKELSEKDPLTGLANRREFESLLVADTELYRTSGAQFSVLAIDIDRFKQVNDKHGHPTGDEVLKRVAHVLERSIRAEDVVARTGGEEFMVLARGIGVDTAGFLAERLRRAVEKERMPESVESVTISIGVAATRKEGPTGGPESGQDLIRAADIALYTAKAAGRNRVFVP
jgi:diguanylate cyclase (GGDEF)-like protein